MQVAALNEQRHDLERPVASPRAARLRELEEVPPDWLRDSIGVCPRRTKPDSGTILVWRRSALAIDDYRSASRSGTQPRSDAAAWISGRLPERMASWNIWAVLTTR